MAETQELGTAAVLPTGLGRVEADPLAPADAAIAEGTNTGITAIDEIRANAGIQGAYALLTESKRYGEFAGVIDSLWERNKEFFPGLTKDDVALNWLAKQRLVEQIAKRSGLEFKKGNGETDTPEMYTGGVVLLATRTSSILVLGRGVHYSSRDLDAVPATASAVVTLPEADAPDEAERVIASPGGGKVMYLQIDKRYADGTHTPKPITEANTNGSVLTGTLQHEDGGRRNLVETDDIPVVGKVVKVRSTNAAGEVSGFYSSSLTRVYYLPHASAEMEERIFNMLKGGFAAVDAGTLSHVAPVTSREE